MTASNGSFHKSLFKFIDLYPTSQLTNEKLDI